MATAPKISQRIALEGGEEIKAQFKGMGEEGKKAFKDIGKAIDESNEKLANVGKGAKAPLDDLTKSAGNAGEAMFTAGQKAVLAIGAVGALGTALYSLARSYLAAADAAAKFVSEQEAAATRAGQSTQNFANTIGALKQLGLTHAEAEQAIKKFGAGSAEAYAKGVAELRKLGISFAPTEAGARAASQMLGNLGESAKDAGGKVSGASEIMRRAKAVFDPLTGTLTQDQKAWENLADSITKIQDPMKRTTALTAVFGEELGRRLSKALAGGGAALKKEAEDFKRISGGLTKTQIEDQEKIASAYEKATTRLEAARQAGRTSTGLVVAEKVTPLIDFLTEATLVFNKGLDDLILGFVEEGGKRLSTTHRELQAIQKGFNEIVDFVTRGASGAWNWVSETATTAWNSAKATAEEAIRIIRKGTTEGEPSAWEWLLSTLEDILAKAEKRWEQFKKLLTQSPEQGGSTGAPGLDSGPAPSPSGELVEAFSDRRRESVAKAVKTALEVQKVVDATAKAGATAERNIIRVGNAADVAGKKTVSPLRNIIEVSKAASSGAKATAAALEPISTLVEQIGASYEQSKAAQEQFYKDGNRGVGQAIDRSTQLRDGVTQIGQTFNQEQAAVKAFYETGAAGAKKVLEGTGGGVTQIGQTFKQEQDALKAYRTSGMKAFHDIGDAATRAKTDIGAVGPVASDAQLNFHDMVQTAKESAGAFAAAGPPIDAFKAKFAGLPTTADAFKASLSLLPPVVGQAFAAAGPAIDAFKAQFQGLPTTTDAFKAKLNELPPVVSQAFTAPAIDAFKAQFSGLPSTTEQFKAALSTLAPVVDQSLGSAAQDATALKAPVDQAAMSATNLGTAFTTGLAGVDAIIGGIIDSIGGLIESISAAIAKMQELGAAQASSGGEAGAEFNPEGYARGGHVRGPGTSTSDSILARLSRGEFVQREKAVRYYGTDFMAALNALRIPKDIFRGFNAGGLVDGLNQSLSALMIPRFAVGGLPDMAPAVASSGGRSLTLVLDGQRFAGLRGPDDTIARLEKHAIAQQSGSTGRKPSWVR